MTLSIIPKPNKVEFYGGEVIAKEIPVEYVTDEKLGDEAYIIDIRSNKIVITSKGEKGRYYAGITLKKLDNNGRFPLVRIEDEPAYGYRGFMIDSARHMQTIDEIKKYIAAAAEFKFNVFHWHLCDDQGWRIECETYPELMEKGAYRDCHGFGSPDARAYGGYYTKDEIRDIIAFCKERYIDVIPEIDMPGHTTAMISTYPWLSCRGDQIPVETRGGIFKDILCAGKDEVYEFCYKLLDEVTELFPYEYVHIGGDEAPKARWCNCEKCQAKIKAEGLKNEEELQGYFSNQIIAFLANKGKKVLCWNESLNSGLINNSTIICDWMDRQHKSEEYANAGGKIIAEDFYHYYLDYPYGMTPLKKTYGFSPLLKRLNEEGRKNVIGVETPIWTEYVEDFDRMCYMCFPRMIACAETGWTKEENKDYASFRERLGFYRKPLEELGIKMAEANAWDPHIGIRIRDVGNHLKKSLTPEAIRVTLFPNKDE